MEKFDKIGTVQELIDALNKIPNKNVGVRLEVNNGEDDPTNYWLYEIQYNPSGTMGYELNGELSLFGGE